MPICSMYGIFTYIWVIFRVNVGKYSIHGAYGTNPVDSISDLFDILCVFFFLMWGLKRGPFFVGSNRLRCTVLGRFNGYRKGHMIYPPKCQIHPKSTVKNCENGQLGHLGPSPFSDDHSHIILMVLQYPTISNYIPIVVGVVSPTPSHL